MPKSKPRKRRRPPPSQRQQIRAKSETAKGPSPRWYTTIMFGLMGLGVVLVLLNYILPSMFARWGLYAGLGAITVGFVMLANYR